MSATRLIPAFLALGAASLTWAGEAPAPRYRVLPVGGPGAEANALNEKGWVAGTASTEGGRRAFRFRGEQVELRSAPGFAHTEGFGINDQGLVVGAGTREREARTADTGTRIGVTRERRALLWEGPRARDLAAGEARDVNNRGVVVGHPEVGPGFRWENGTATALTDPASDYPLHPRAINDRGDMVGLAQGSSSRMSRDAFLWSGGELRLLNAGYTGGAQPAAFALNEQGEVAGVGGGLDGIAFLWTAGQRRTLGTMNGTAEVGVLGQHKGYHVSIALGVNDRRQVVGTANVTDEGAKEMRAFLWEQGRLQNLNTLIQPDSGWVLEEARAINNRGEICGVGRLRGERRAFLLKPAAR